MTCAARIGAILRDLRGSLWRDTTLQPFNMEMEKPAIANSWFSARHWRSGGTKVVVSGHLILDLHCNCLLLSIAESYLLQTTWEYGLCTKVNPNYLGFGCFRYHFQVVNHQNNTIISPHDWSFSFIIRSTLIFFISFPPSALFEVWFSFELNHKTLACKISVFIPPLKLSQLGTSQWGLYACNVRESWAANISSSQCLWTTAEEISTGSPKRTHWD